MTAPPQIVTAVAPGFAVPGEQRMMMYGSGFTPGTAVWFIGPVYSTTNFSVPLCGVQLGDTCPSQAVSGTASADQKSLGFAVPSDASPGVYRLIGDRTSPNGGVFVMVTEP